MYRLDDRLQQDTIKLGQFNLCDVLLMNDSQYPWVILVPRRPDVREIFHLSDEDQLALLRESTLVNQRMADAFEADSMNVAALGNVVTQLHLHHVVRFKTDATWPKPVWGGVPVKPYSDADKKEMATKISRLLADHFVKPGADSVQSDTTYW